MALQLEDFLPFYPEIIDPDLQREIFAKKEFFDHKLQASEKPIEKGARRKLDQQVIVERFFSEFTPYDEGLIYHAMGTGKTCAAFSLSESLKHRKALRACYVLARGDDSLDNLRRELASKCSQDYMIDSRGLAPEAVARKVKKIVKDFYIFKTYYTFAKEIVNLSDAALDKIYNKSIFIVDEAHHIQEQSIKEDNLDIYAQIHRLFHQIQERKILLLTGTPMRDDVSEIAGLMNLILPLNKQLPIGNEFKKEFLILQEDETYIVNPAKENLLKEYIRGRISYLGEPKYDIEVRWRGNSISKPDIPQFRADLVTMSSHQKKAYRKAFEMDTAGEKRGIYSNSIQASLFVFPDGSWGAEGFQNYKKNAAFWNELKSMNLLERYSVKYHHVIQTLQSNPRKNIFVYCSAVHGSGLFVLAKILEKHGYERYNGKQNAPAKRYAILTSENPHILDVVNGFNRNRNKTGSFCQIIIGSRKISEGYSFKNIQIELLLTQYWNEAETSQASRRGARFGSWNAFRDNQDGSLPPNLFLSISKVCAIASDDNNPPSIDLLMLEISKRKDISIKRMDRVIKESAFDCPLTYERNRQDGSPDGSRECDYTVCNYECDSKIVPEEGGLDISTYELYYENYFDLIDPIKELFRQRDSFSFDTVYELIRPAERIQLLKALSYIIENNIEMTNRFDCKCYLRENMNLYFLSRNIVRNSFEISDLENPIFSRRFTLDETIDDLQIKRTESVLASGEDIFLNLPAETIDTLVKLALKEYLVEGNKNERCKEVIDFFKDRITIPKKAGAEFIASYKSEDETWCLKKEGWVICVTRAQPTAVSEISAPYEGILSEDGKFCIKKVQQDVVLDKRKRTTGAVCEQAGWSKAQLAEIVRELKIPNIDLISSKATICSNLLEWFKKNKMVRRGKCGTPRRQKV